MPMPTAPAGGFQCQSMCWARSSVTDMFAKMGAAKVRRGDGMWYYLERRVELPEEEKDVMADLPF